MATKMIVHHELYRYLVHDVDDYWIEDGDTIIITKKKEGFVHYETSDYEDAGRFPEWFLDTDNSYWEWLDNKDNGN